MTKKSRSNQAVSEVLDIVLLLGITIGLFAFLNYIVFSYSFNESSPSVNLIGSIDNNMINIKHNGGELLGSETRIIFNIAGAEDRFTIEEIRNRDDVRIIKSDGSEELPEDTSWSIGEIVQIGPIHIPANSYIKVLVVDPSTNSLVLSAELQQGN
jgi:hypothetical protein